MTFKPIMSAGRLAIEARAGTPTKTVIMEVIVRRRPLLQPELTVGEVIEGSGRMGALSNHAHGGGLTSAARPRYYSSYSGHYD